MEGAVKLSVTRDHDNRLTEGEICLKFTITDTGIGIKTENLEKIFSRYDQGSANEHRNIEGTGLGLDITRQLAELMNGNVSVKSEYGKGSVFAVTVRQTVINSDPVGSEIAHTLTNLTWKNRNIAIENLHHSRMHGVRVLVVDDVSSNLEVARGFLNLYGMKVDCAQGGEEALQILRKNAALYDLVFMDHMMPGIDGPGVLKTIRDEIGGIHAGSLPVIALSANALAGSKKMFLEMGFQDFIPKPIDPLLLDKILKKWIPEQKIENSENDSVCNAVLSGSQQDSVTDTDEEAYRYLIDSFCRDSEEKMNLLRHIMYNIDNVSDTAITILETILQTMKNSAVSIGAKEIATEAATLGEKLSAKDIAALSSTLPAFYDHVKHFTDRIREKYNL